MAARKLKLMAGGTVRLKHDLTTRGNRTFRAGLVMSVNNTTGGITLSVRFRGRRFWITLEKKRVEYYVEVLTEPPPAE